MLALILAELTHWNQEPGRRTLSILVCCSTLAGFLFAFYPEFYFWGMLLTFIWIGFSIGERGGANIHLETGNGFTRLTRLQIVVGKSIAAGILILFHIIALLPVAILLKLVWGVPGVATGMAGFDLWVAAIVAAGSRILIRRWSGRWNRQ